MPKTRARPALSGRPYRRFSHGWGWDPYYPFLGTVVALFNLFFVLAVLLANLVARWKRPARTQKDRGP